MYEKLDNLESKFKMTDFPLNLGIEVCNYCNLNCVMCAHDKMRRPKGNMDIRLYKKIIDETAEKCPGARIWLDFYGEPLLSKYKLYYMIKYANEKGVTNINMNTNATLMDEEMAEMLLDSGLTYLSIDCDGFSKEVYESIRLGADRDVVYKNIEYILERKKELGYKLPVIDIKIIEMEENKHEVDKVLEYWRAKGAWTAKRRPHTWGGNSEHISINDIENRIACGKAVGTLPIVWDGTAVNCPSDIQGEVVWGDVNTESIEEIWKRRNEKMVSLQLEHRFSELPLQCQHCNDWQLIGEERFDEFGNPRDRSYSADEKMYEEK